MQTSPMKEKHTHNESSSSYKVVRGRERASSTGLSVRTKVLRNKKPSLGPKSTHPKRTSFLLLFQNSTCSTLSVSFPTCFQSKLEGLVPLTRVNNKEVPLWNATLSASIQKDISPVGDNRAGVLKPWEGVGAEDPTLGPEQLWGRQEPCSCCRRAWGSTSTTTTKARALRMHR